LLATWGDSAAFWAQWQLGDPVFRGWSRQCGEPGVDYPQPARGHGRRRRDIKARICNFAEHHTAGQAAPSRTTVTRPPPTT
jgi:hypothetical protein